MGSLWQFFGLPDPEGGASPTTRTPAPEPSQGPVSLSAPGEAEAAPPSSICARSFTWKVTRWLVAGKLSTWRTKPE